jgi:predicted Zn finger-like uncharacterized protein
MSLTTRCPACGTRFRVVPDQLKISDGWVRCGHCADVFDATLHLSAWVPPPPAAEPEPELASEPEIPPVPQPDPPSVETADDNPISDFQAALQAFASQSSSPPQPPGLDLDLSSELPPEPAPVPPVPPPPAEPERPAHDDPPTEIPGFVQQARRQAFWRSAPMRSALLLLTLVLCVLLAGQWALHQRSWVAARYPAVKPLLVQACDLLACTVEPLRRIDAIVIDSATLVRRLGQFHSFDIVLQNTADLPLAAPALELSLTDASDRVIARRVFLPQEWPDAVSELPPRATVPVSFRLSIASGDDLPMAGYRALVFYP